MAEEVGVVSEIKDEQVIVSGKTPAELETSDKKADEPKEGFSHLTDADLNPDFVEPEEEETESTTEEEVTETAQAESDESEVVEEDSSESEEWSINGTTYSSGDVDRMVKDYSNLSSHTGRQAEEVGKLKAKIELMEQAEQTEAGYSDSEPESTEKEYDIYSVEGIQELADEIASKKLKQYQSEVEKQANLKTAEDGVNEARQKFLDNHKDMKDDDLLDLIKYGESEGLILSQTSDGGKVYNYFEQLNAMKSNDYSHFAKDGAKKNVSKVVEKVKEGQKIQKGLGSVSSSESDDIDYDSLSYDDWESLPRSKRDELLGIT